jgi:hypothetical protein
VVDPRKPVQCFGREASAHAHELLDGLTVSIETAPPRAIATSTDGCSRTSGYPMGGTSVR